MLVALTRRVSPSLAECELSYLDRQPIDATLAERQHAGYESCLRQLGARVIALPAEPAYPDAVFIEDTAVVVEEVAILTRPGAHSRRGEVRGVGAVLERWRPLREIAAPGQLEGGDVLRIGRRLFVGRSVRTNDEGIAQLGAVLAPYGYEVAPVQVTGCLHLKSACAYLGREVLLANRGWLDLRPFGALTVIDVPREEPGAANALLVGEQIVLPAAFPLTRALLQAADFQVLTVEVSELQKAEGGVTCCSILFDDTPVGPA